MLNVVLVIAHFTVWECPNGNDRKNEKGNYNTKNCHGRIFLTIKFRSTNYIICKINLKNCVVMDDIEHTFTLNSIRNGCFINIEIALKNLEEL